MMKRTVGMLAVLAVVVLVSVGIMGYLHSPGTQNPTFQTNRSTHLRARHESTPGSSVKMSPETVAFPPVFHSNEWETPVPTPGPVNAAGAEDSPLITSDGERFFFLFIPDPLGSSSGSPHKSGGPWDPHILLAWTGNQSYFTIPDAGSGRSAR